MEHILAARSVSITELKRSPSAVLEQAGSETVAVLNHNRPAAYLVPPHIYQAMADRLNADLRAAIQEGVDSGRAIPAEEIFKELDARYADSQGKHEVKSNRKRQVR